MKINTEKQWDVQRLELQAKGKIQYDMSILNDIGIDCMQNARVLDLGCSNGFKTYQLFNKSNIEQVVGIDWSQKAIDEANEKYGQDKKFQFICEDVYKINFEKKFDIVYISFVLHHVQDKLGLLTKVYSLLKKGGYVVIKTIDDSSIISYPDKKHIVDKIKKLYDRKIKPLSINTMHTDRYHGKKCHAQLVQTRFSNIRLMVTSKYAANKSDEQKDKSFEVGFGFRNVENITGFAKIYKRRMDKLLKQAREMFDDSRYIYINPAYYYSAQKLED